MNVRLCSSKPATLFDLYFAKRESQALLLRYLAGTYDARRRCRHGLPWFGDSTWGVGWPSPGAGAIRF